jgi:hypothetical protein
VELFPAKFGDGVGYQEENPVYHPKKEHMKAVLR